MEIIRRIQPAKDEINTSSNDKKAKKMRAYERLEKMRQKAVFPSNIDFEKEVQEAIGEKYSGFA